MSLRSPARERFAGGRVPARAHFGYGCDQEFVRPAVWPLEERARAKMRARAVCWQWSPRFQWFERLVEIIAAARLRLPSADSHAADRLAQAFRLRRWRSLLYRSSVFRHPMD